MSPTHTKQRRRGWTPWLLSGMLMVLLAGPASAAPKPGVEVDDRDRPALTESAIRAFDYYLAAVDAGDLDTARDHVLDPGHHEGRLTVVEKLLGFIRARLMSEIANEGVVVRMRGDWALVVYQYDTTVDSQTTRIITTAWMIQTDGYWRQFIVSPRDRSFWVKHRADYEALQRWFDDHARQITGQADTPIEIPA